MQIGSEELPQESSDVVSHQIGRRTTVGAGLVIVSKVLSRCVDLAAVAALARLLTPADFGLVAIATSLMMIVDAVLELQVTTALMALPERTKAHFDTAFTLQLARGAALTAILVIAAWPLSVFYHDHRLVALLCALSLAPASSSLASPRMTEYAYKLDFRPTFVMEVAGKLMALVFSVGAAWWTGSYWALALGAIASPLTWMVVSYIYAPYSPKLTLAKWDDFSRFLRWITATQLLTAINWQMDQLLLGRLISRVELGAFSVASNLASMPGQMFIGQTFKPLLVGFSLVRDDRRRLTQAYLKSVNSIVTAGLPLLVGICVTAEPLIRVVLGDQWSQAAPSLRWLSLAFIPSLFIAPFGPFVLTLNRPSVFFKISLGEFLIKLPLILVGVIYYGVAGVIAVRLMTGLLVTGWSMLVVRSLAGLLLVTQLFFPWRSITSVLLMALVLELLGRTVPDGHDHFQLVVWLLSTSVVGAAIYGGTLFLLWFLAGRPDDGIETKVIEFLSTRFYDAVRYRS